jgi:hypothetical protein
VHCHTVICGAPCPTQWERPGSIKTFLGIDRGTLDILAIRHVEYGEKVVLHRFETFA